MHRRRRETGVQTIAIEPSRMSGGEVLELDTPQRGPYVRSNGVLVPFVGALAHGVPYIVEPPIQVFPDRQAASVKHEAVGPVRKCLRQLVSDVLALLAGEIPALRAICRVHPVGTPIADHAAVLVPDRID